MPAGLPPTPRFIQAGRIVTCDPTQRIVEVLLLNDARRVQISTFPVAARWPMVGETWTVEFVNNVPYLREPYPIGYGINPTTIEKIPAGDAFINSPTGRVHVIGSADGKTDFTIQTSSVPLYPSGEDDTDAINKAIESGRLLGAGTFLIYGRVIIPDSKGLVAIGEAILKCMTVDAGVSSGFAFTHTGEAATGVGYNANWVVEGNNISAQPLFLNCTEGVFEQIGARFGTGDGIIVGGQNNIFTNLQSGGHGGACLVLDNGAGGNVFTKPEFNFAGTYHIIVRSSMGAEGSGYGIPEYNYFEDGICEGGPFSGTGLRGNVYITAGRFIFFKDMQFFTDKFATGFHSGVRIANAFTGETNPDTGYNVVGDIIFRDCTFGTNALGTTYAIEADGRSGNVPNPFFGVLFPYNLQGTTTVIAYTKLHLIGTTTAGRVEGPVTYANGTTEYATEGSGTIIPPWRMRSHVTNFTGALAPTTPGWYAIGEPWSSNLVSAVRFVPTEDMLITLFGFTVIFASGSDDLCDVGVVDIYGTVLAHSGLQSGKLNVSGDQFINLSITLYGGVAYYLAFGCGTIGSSPAVLKVANYMGMPENSGHLTGFGTSSFGYQDTLLWNTSDGSIQHPTSYWDYGQGVILSAREF